MSRLVLVSAAQMKRLTHRFPHSRELARVDDRRVVGGIVYVIGNGLRWTDAPPGYDPPKTLYNRFIRQSRLGVFDRIFVALLEEAGVPERLMIDSAHLKAHRTAASLLKKGCSAVHWTDERRPEPQAACRLRRPRPTGRHDAHQRADERHKGAALLLPVLPPAGELFGDREYNSDGFRDGLRGREIEPCIPSTKNRKVPLAYDKVLYRQRHRIENTFGRMKDWRRVATRFDRCAHAFFSAICIAVTSTFWLPR